MRKAGVGGELFYVRRSRVPCINTREASFWWARRYQRRGRRPRRSVSVVEREGDRWYPSRRPSGRH